MTFPSTTSTPGLDRLIRTTATPPGCPARGAFGNAGPGDGPSCNRVFVNRDLEWAPCVNVRDLGGLPTSEGGRTEFGVIVRADNVRLLSREGWDAARDYGVSTVLDLRSEGERAADAAVPIGFNVVTISLFDDFDSDPAYRRDIGFRVVGLCAAEAYRALYTEALDRNRAMFGAALNAIAVAPGTVLMHCTGGKDRTGLLAALLARLAGVSIAVADKDYQRSELRLGIRDSAPAGVMDTVLAGVEQQFDKVEHYFLQAGATASAIERVRVSLSG